MYAILANKHFFSESDLRHLYIHADDHNNFRFDHAVSYEI